MSPENFEIVMEEVRTNVEYITSGQICGGNWFLTLRDPSSHLRDNLVSVFEMLTTKGKEPGPPWAPSDRDQIELIMYTPTEERTGRVPGWAPGRSWTFETRRTASTHYTRVISHVVRMLAMK